MNDGDKDYKFMLPCYYVEKTDEVKECAWQSFTLITIQNNFFQKTDKCNYLEYSEDAVLVLYFSVKHMFYSNVGR